MHVYVNVNDFKMIYKKSKLVDNPLKRLSVRDVQRQPKVYFRQADVTKSYEIVMFASKMGLKWHVSGISGRSLSKGKMYGKQMKVGNKYSVKSRILKSQ